MTIRPENMFPEHPMRKHVYRMQILDYITLPMADQDLLNLLKTADLTEDNKWACSFEEIKIFQHLEKDQVEELQEIFKRFDNDFDRIRIINSFLLYIDKHKNEQ
jgi:hypothetical protein